jgi:hypothetical protein
MNSLRLLFTLLGCILAGAAWAHPVAQGSLELRVEQGAIVAAFRVSNEQVFVQTSLGQAVQPANSLEELWWAHGNYLLGHVQVLADGAELRGELTNVEPSSDVTVNGFATYTLRFPVATEPARVEVKEDLLNEIVYSPGNMWEASFTARVLKDGVVLQEAMLLSHKEPLAVDLAAAKQGLGALAWSYFKHGVEHITSAWDHALFVTALVLAVARFWPIVALVTAFTVAHTLTLTLVALRWLPAPGHFVEPMIAGSIVVAAAINLFRPTGGPLKPRMAVAFGFGLFHGLGFAGDLANAMQGFSKGALLSAISGFSIGVEAGHQMVVLPLVLVMAAIRHFSAASVPTAARIGSAAVAIAGCYMFVGTLR